MLITKLWTIPVAFLVLILAQFLPDQYQQSAIWIGAIIFILVALGTTIGLKEELAQEEEE